MNDYERCISLLRISHLRCFNDNGFRWNIINFPVKNKQTLEILETFKEYDERFYWKLRQCKGRIAANCKFDEELSASIDAFFPTTKKITPWYEGSAESIIEYFQQRANSQKQS